MPTSPAIAEALEDEIGHPPPYDADELAEVTQLVVRGATALDGLEGCREAWQLSLDQCDLPGLAVCVRLEALEMIDATNTRCGGLADLAGHPTIDQLILHNLDLVEVDSLLELPSLAFLTILGCPLSENARRALHDPDFADRVSVTLDSEPVWELNRRLHDRGLPFGAVERDGRMVLHRRGLTRVPDGLDWAEVTADDVRALLAEAEPDVDAWIAAKRG